MNVPVFRILRPGGFAWFVLTAVVAVSGGGCASTPGRSPRMPPSGQRADAAGVIRGSWQGVESLQLRSPLLVVLKRGDRIDGRFKSVTGADLTLTDSAGREFSVPKSAIETIARKVGDEVGNGALIGAGVGFGAGLAVLAVVASEDGYVLPSAKWGAPLLLSGFGSLVGMLVDRNHERDQLVYLAAHR